MNRPSASPASPVILYDGVCNLCWFWVRFLLKRDASRVLRFAPLQSPTAHALLAAHGMQVPELSTVVLVSDRGVHLRSSAILHAMRTLPPPWRMCYGLIVIPRPIRDAIYTFIGRRRYRWFGHADTCYLPDAGDRDRFL